MNKEHKGHEFILEADGTWDEPHYSEVCRKCGALNTMEGSSLPCIDEDEDD